MVTICPMPEHWNSVYERLSQIVESSSQVIPKPPTPLILAGWVFTNDLEKKGRWHETIEWAEKWGGSEIIHTVTPEMMYQVEVPTEYIVGPYGGPMHLSWNSDPLPVVRDEDAEGAISRLKSNWGKIVGPELSAVTNPIRLTGSKMRRLLVYADQNHIPAWGSWTMLADSPQRREFTKFRSAINEAICPLMVDHVDFIHEKQ